MTERARPATAINIVFDGPPGDGPGLVEIEDDEGHSLSIGKWVDRGDGYWALRIPCRIDP